MNPKVIHAQRACEAAKARQAVVVFIDEVGQYAVASYGETKAECAAVKPLCNAIADALDEGELPMPGGSSRLGGERKSERQREFDSLAAERNKYHAQSQDLEKKLAAIATLVSIYDNQDEPEGQVSARRALTAIGETIGQPCSICRSRHGSEVRHACE